MESNDITKKTSTLMYALVKEARRSSLTEFLEEWSLTIEDYDEIMENMKDKLGIKIP